jgi:phosphatidylinositol-3-phosphatase
MHNRHHMTAAIIVACLAVIATPFSSTGATARNASTTQLKTAVPSAAPSSGHAIRTVFLIVMENNNWSSIKGNASAPYINTTLLPIASHAEQYYNPPGVHPSLPNYLWLEAGTNFGILDDNSPWSHRLTTSSGSSGLHVHRIGGCGRC